MAQLVAHMTGGHGAASSSLVTPTTSRQSPLCFDFFYTKKSSACFLASPFHKKSRSARLFGCKRPLDDLLSLSTFCEFFVLSYPLVPNYFFQAKSALLRLFLYKKVIRLLPCLSFSQKVTLRSSVPVQAPSQRLTGANNFL